MLAVENTLISESILEKKFVCDLNACKGECCVAGDSGAPLEKDELPILDSILENVKPYMVKNGVKAIEKHGAYVIDGDGDYTTTLVSEGAECAFVFFDENKIAKCAIEQAYREGKIKWQKPISCHLYPIRISKLKNFTALNYHYWKICKPACDCGNKLDVPVYKFLKEPLIRKFGEKWYKTLVQSAEIYLKK
jgi:hypothetical protein